MTRKQEVAEKVRDLIAKALTRKEQAWALSHMRPAAVLRSATGIDVCADWRLPGGIDLGDAETALKLLLRNAVQRTALSSALVEAFALENPDLFAKLAIGILTVRGAHEIPDPYDLAQGMLSGLPPACIAGWYVQGAATERPWAQRERKERVADKIGADIQWVTSEETLAEITRQHEQRRTERRAARLKAKAEASP